MNKRTKQILAATATLLLLIILQSISLPTESRSLSAWQPAANRTSAAIADYHSLARERHGHDFDELRSRPTR